MTVLDAFRSRTPHPPGPPAPGQVVIEATGVGLSYGDQVVLEEVDLAVRAGELLALVGPNGAGKSTLLGVLSGDVRPHTGRVTVDGEDLSRWSHEELAMRRGVLLQQVDVSFPFSVTQIVRMGRVPWSGTPAEAWDDDVVARSLDETDVTHLRERVYSSLSGGERTRAALARVLAQEPGALLLDEPTASLDIRHQELTLAVARHRVVRGDAVVVVMHDLGLAAAYADRVLVLSHGRAEALGPPEEVLTEDTLTRVYEHPIEVFRHPRTDELVVHPHRPRRSNP